MTLRSTPRLLQVFIVAWLAVLGAYTVVATIGCLVAAKFLWAGIIVVVFGGLWLLYWRRYRRTAFTLTFDPHEGVLTWRGALLGGSIPSAELLEIRAGWTNGPYRIRSMDRPDLRIFVLRPTDASTAFFHSLVVSNPQLTYPRADPRLAIAG